MLTLKTVETHRTPHDGFWWLVAVVLIALSILLLWAMPRQAEQIEELGERGLWTESPTFRATDLARSQSLSTGWSAKPAPKRARPIGVSEATSTPLPPQNPDGSWRGFLVPHLGCELPMVTVPD